jgi:subtilisin family serine protease
MNRSRTPSPEGPVAHRTKAFVAVLAMLVGGSLVAAAPAGAASAPAPAATTVKVDVLVRVEPGTEGPVAQQVRLLGGDPAKPLTVLPGFLAKVPTDRVATVAAIPGVTGVVDGVDIGFDPALYDQQKISSSLYQIALNIGADQSWKNGYTGAGVDVAVIDSGVAAVPELQGNTVTGPDLSFGSGDAADGMDLFGHGTHMSGIIAGRDPSVPLDARSLPEAAKTKFVGIAPGARIVNMKVAAPDGAVDVSQVIAAIDWVVQHRGSDGLNIRVLNLSFGTDGIQDYQVDPLTFAVENAWKHGIVVVVSAGNDGYGSPRLNDPAYDPYVLAVGASDTNGTTSQSDDFIADFSSRGDATRRPDVVAPGRSVVSLRAPDSLIDQAFPGGRIGDTLFRGSGTSQAAAVTSGAVALLLQQYPTLTPDQVKAALVNTGLKLKTSKGVVLDAGMKSIDLDQAAGKVKDVLAGKIASVQSFPPATGLGSLDAARGSEHLADGETILRGEVDVTGAAWDPATWSAASANGLTWSNAAWTGARWRDAQWNGARWKSDGWTGSRWRDASWTGSRWRNDTWTGTRWRDDSWTGSRWRGSGWMAAEFIPVPLQ